MTAVPRVLRLQVRRADLRVAAPIDHYLEAEIVPKFNPVSLETCGTFMVRVPMQVRDGGGRLRPYRAATALLEDGAGFVASLDRGRFFNGLVEETEQSKTGSSAAMLDVFGYSDDSLVAVRKAFQVPGSDVLADQALNAYDVRTGAAQTVVNDYVAANLGAGARLSSRVPGFTVAAAAAPPLGSDVAPVDGRARFDNLAELVSSLCLRGGGLGWRVVQVGAGLVFEVFEPRDRSRHARFSPALRNLTEYKLKKSKRKVTRAIAAGGGQGTARLYREAVEPAAWYEYRETSVDRRDTGGGADAAPTAEELAKAIAELDQAAKEALLAGVQPASFTAPVQDTPAVGFLRPDAQGGYGPLDRVTVTAGGVSIVDIVRQVSVKATKEQAVSITPTVGVPDQAPSSTLIRRLREAEQRLYRLERSQ